MTETKPKRRIRFSLKALMVAVSLLAVLMWWLVVYPEQKAKWFVELMATDPTKAESLSQSGMWEVMRKYKHASPYYEAHPRSLWDKLAGRAVFTVAIPIQDKTFDSGRDGAEIIGTLIVVRGSLLGPIEMDERIAPRQ